MILKSNNLKRNIFFLLGGAFGVSLLLALYSDLDSFGGALSGFDVRYLPAILLMAPLNYVFRFVKWTYYLKLIDVRLNIKDSVVIFLSGLAMTVTPGKLGEFLKSYMIKERYGIPVSRTASMVVAERITDGISMLILAFVGFTSLRYGFAALMFCAVASGIGVVVIQNKKWCLYIIERLGRVPFLKNTVAALKNMYLSAYELFRLGPLLFAVGIGIVSWSFEGVIVYLTLIAFGSPIGLFESLFIVAFSSIVGALSMLPGGILAAEVSIVGVLTLLNVPRAIASGTAIISRVSTLWLGVCIGLAAMYVAVRMGFFRFDDNNENPAECTRSDAI